MQKHRSSSFLTCLLTLVGGSAIVLLVLGEAYGSGLHGDANCDGELNPVDATLVLQLQAGLFETLPCENAAADFNLDGSVNSIDATLILQVVAELIPPPTPRARTEVVLEAENGTGDGQTMERGSASNDATVWLHIGETQRMTLKLPMGASYTLEAKYSNDGMPDDVEVKVDGVLLGDFTTKDTRPEGGAPGSGWNVFNLSSVNGTADLSAGDHRVEVTVIDSDSFGVEIDLVRLELVPPTTPTATLTSTPAATSTPPPTATLTPTPEPPLEAENGTGDGQTMPRGSASNLATVWLQVNETRSMTFNLQTGARYTVEAAYSNDGLPDTVEVKVDGVVLGKFTTKDTRPEGGALGSGWDVFNLSGVIGTADLSAGDHKMEVTVIDGDSFGVEIDVVRLERLPTETPMPTATPTATSTPTPTTTFTPTSEPLIEFLEAENGTGDGQTMPRGNASNSATVWLHIDETRSMTFNLQTGARYTVEAAYSNDGLPDTVEVKVDGVVLGQFTTKDTRPEGGAPGSGWDVFNLSGVIGTVDLSAGDHKVEVTVIDGDSFGVEIDMVRLERTD